MHHYTEFRNFSPGDETFCFFKDRASKFEDLAQVRNALAYLKGTIPALNRWHTYKPLLSAIVQTFPPNEQIKQMDENMTRDVQLVHNETLRVPDALASLLPTPIAVSATPVNDALVSTKPAEKVSAQEKCLSNLSGFFFDNDVPKSRGRTRSGVVEPHRPTRTATKTSGADKGQYIEIFGLKEDNGRATVSAPATLAIAKSRAAFSAGNTTSPRAVLKCTENQEDSPVLECIRSSSSAVSCREIAGLLSSQVLEFDVDSIQLSSRRSLTAASATTSREGSREPGFTVEPASQKQRPMSRETNVDGKENSSRKKRRTIA